jgi:hypothetical protein
MPTENLVLNAYRQLASTGSIVFAVDTSYRYAHEKFGLMPIKAVNLEQQGKTIVYAICLNEDHKLHEYIFKAIYVLKSKESSINSLMKATPTYR